MLHLSFQVKSISSRQAKLPALRTLELAVEVRTIFGDFYLGVVGARARVGQMVFAWRVEPFLLARTENAGSAAASLAIEVESSGVQPLFGLVGPWSWTLQSSVGDFQDILSLGSQ